MRLLLLLSFFIFSTLIADTKEQDPNPFSIRIGGGYADKNDLGEILTGNWHIFEKNTAVLNLDGGWRFVHNAFDLPLDFYLKGGISRFYERGYQDDFFEGTLYIKAYWKFDFLQNRIRIGLGEGISFAQEIPVVESDEASDGITSRFLNYLDVSADFDLGRLIRVDALQELYIGYTIKHRSGVFGAYNSVSHGGSNYHMLTVEKNF